MSDRLVEEARQRRINEIVEEFQQVRDNNPTIVAARSLASTLARMEAALEAAERRVDELDVRYAGAMRLLLAPLERVVATTVALTPREAADLLVDVHAVLAERDSTEGPLCPDCGFTHPDTAHRRDSTEAGRG